MIIHLTHGNASANLFLSLGIYSRSFSSVLMSSKTSLGNNFLITCWSVFLFGFRLRFAFLGALAMINANLVKVMERFGSEDKCRAYLETLR